MEFLLIRHTRGVVQPGVCYGRLDLALPVNASVDIDVTLRQVRTVEAVFSSSSTRCLSLARQLSQRDECDLHVLDELRELHFGAWEGMRWDDVSRAHSDHWADDTWNRAPPEGESESALFDRVQVALAMVLRKQFDCVAIVSHAGPLRLLRCLLLDLPLSARWSWTIAPGEVCSVTRP
jgi:alpha-ribazole phosphatase